MLLTQSETKHAAPNGDLYSWQVSRATGATNRQLQWWDERGYIVPTIDRHRRRYTAAQVEQVRRFMALRKAGVSLQDIRRLKLTALPWKSVRTARKAVLIGDVLVVPYPGDAMPKPPPLSDAQQIEIALLLQRQQREKNPLYTVWLDLGRLYWREAPWYERAFMSWFDAIALTGWVHPDIVQAPPRPVSITRRKRRAS